MSFERFSSSDIYMYEHVGGFIECCACSLAIPEDQELFGFTWLKTPREALAHLDLHEEVGDDIGKARKRIKQEYVFLLDAEIQPYVPDPEAVEARKAFFKSLKDESHPPKEFRDRSNGE